MRQFIGLAAAFAVTVLSGCSEKSEPAASAGSGGSPTTGAGGASGGSTSAGGSKSAQGGSPGSSGGTANPSGGNGSTTGGSPGTSGSGGSTSGGMAGATSSYNPCPPVGQDCKVLPLGDSITEGYPNAAAGGYRVPLFRAAHQAGKALTFVGGQSDGPDMVEGVPFPKNHEGHGGWSIGQIKGKLAEPAVLAFAPHIVLLHAGTNDVESWAEGGDPTATPEALATRLGELLDLTVQSFPNSLVAVATNIPFRDTAAAPYNDRGSAYNALIPGVVSSRAAQGKHVILVDQNAAFRADPNFGANLMADDDHPNPAGYTVMGNTWFVAIGGMLR